MRKSRVTWARCLVARRLLERGVRFVQIWSGADNGFPRRNWDSHEDLAKDHLDMATSMDQPTGALLKDLKARGLLEDTIVLWTTEFGRMPCSQGGKGRDHNPFGFTNWLAGGGIRGGVSFGATDEWSYKATEHPTYCYDVHATMLHLLGINHEKLTFRHNGIDRRLTDVHGELISEILA
jgi:arylsulfatase A-like enzyme